MQAPKEAVELTSVYVRICGGGIFFIVAYNLLSAIFRGLGDSKSPLLFVFVACIVNVIGDIVLVAGFHMDAAGAAIATVAAQALSVVFAIVILIKKELPFKITRKDFGLNSQCKKFLKIGLPLALQEFLTQMSFLALCAFVNRLGLEASSGYGVACKIVNFAMLVPSALMQSMASFVSQNIGAGKAKRAKKSMFTGIGVGLVVGCIVFLLVMFGGDILAGFFTTDVAVIQKGYAYLKGFALETIVTAILFSMVGYFNGNNKTVWVMTQGLIQTLLVRLPFAYVMSIQPNASLTKIGLAAPVSTMVGIVLNVGFYIYLDVLQERAFGFHASIHLFLVVFVVLPEHLHQRVIAMFQSEKGVLDLLRRDEVVTLHDFLIVFVDAHTHLVEHAVRFECRRASARDTSPFGVPQLGIDGQFAAELRLAAVHRNASHDGYCPVLFHYLTFEVVDY